MGRNLFNNCLKGILKGKTRVLVTHQLQYLSEVDRILVLKETSHGGTVAEFGNTSFHFIYFICLQVKLLTLLYEGTFPELMARSSEFTKIIHDHVQNEQEQQEEKVPVLTESEEAQFTNAQGATVSASTTGIDEKEEKKESKKQVKLSEEEAVVKGAPKKLMTVEERRVGHIGATTYKNYLSAFPGINNF